MADGLLGLDTASGVLSPEPGSGKTRALEVAEPLVPDPIHSVNVTSAYLFRKIAEERATLLYDDIDRVVWPKAKENKDIRGVLNSGHRNGATAGPCVVRGKVVETEELPSYCAVAIAGLKRPARHHHGPQRRGSYAPLCPA